MIARFNVLIFCLFFDFINFLLKLFDFILKILEIKLIFSMLFGQSFLLFLQFLEWLSALSPTSLQVLSLLFFFSTTFGHQSFNILCTRFSLKICYLFLEHFCLFEKLFDEFLLFTFEVGFKHICIFFAEFLYYRRLVVKLWCIHQFFYSIITKENSIKSYHDDKSMIAT